MEKIYLQDGTTRESLFSLDNFASRRTTGHNLYDPDSLLTGAEVKAGLGYRDPRVWVSYEAYVDACEGRLGVNDIEALGPRQAMEDILPFLAGTKALRTRTELENVNLGVIQ